MARAVAAVRSLLLVAFVVSATALVAPTDAGAVLHGYYNCVLKPSGQWCDGQANGTYDGLHSWDYNEGWYPGPWNGSVTACQRLYRPSTGTTLTGSSCTVNWTAFSYGSVSCICYRAEVKQISGGAHSINGYAIAY